MIYDLEFNLVHLGQPAPFWGVLKAGFSEPELHSERIPRPDSYLISRDISGLQGASIIQCFSSGNTAFTPFTFQTSRCHINIWEISVLLNGYGIDAQLATVLCFLSLVANGC